MRILVMAPSLIMARDWATEEKLGPHEWKYVSRIQDLHGYGRHTMIHVIPYFPEGDRWYGFREDLTDCVKGLLMNYHLKPYERRRRYLKPYERRRN